MEVRWSIKLIDKRGFYLVVEFTNEDYVSQYERDLDSLELFILEPEAFLTADGQRITSFDG